MNIKAALLLFAMLLSACNEASTPQATSVPPTAVPPTEASTNIPLPSETPLPTATPQPTETPLPTNTPTPENTPTPFACTDALDCVQLDPGQAIQIGYILALTGGASFLGQEEINGVELAVERAGKLLGHEIQIKGFDGGCDPVAGRTAALSLAQEPKLIGVIGPTCSSAARAINPWLSKAGMVIISPSASQPALTKEGDVAQYAGFFRTSPNDIQEGVLAAQMANEKLKVKTAATIISPDLVPVQKAFVETFISLGGEVLMEETVDSPDSLPALKAKLADLAPEMLYLAISDISLAGQLIAQVRDQPELESMVIVGYDSLFNPELEKIAGLAADGVILSQVVFNPQLEEYNAEILPAYNEKFGKQPEHFIHAFAMDAVSLLLAAIEQVGVVYPDGTLYIPRQALRDALYATQDFPGLTGKLTCSPTGDCADPRTTLAFFTYMYGVWPPTPFLP
jgi:branched-chain amino acid transport system substrate-binding protein